jgi:hypothetical protein
VASDGWESIGHRLLLELKKLPPQERIGFVKGRVSMLSPDQRKNVENFLLAVVFALRDVPAVSDKPPIQWEKPAAFGFGIGFMIVLLVLAIEFPNPTPFQYEIFRIVLSIGVAGFAACIPGLLQVKFGNWLAASGAIAVFVIVYFFNPAKIVLDQTAPQVTLPPKTAR